VSQKPTFEESRTELEQIVQRLEQGQVPLDEAIALWQRGEVLYALCLESLDAAQGQIEQLAQPVEATRSAPDPSHAP